MNDHREQLLRLAARVQAMVTTARPGPHQSDLSEIHGHVLAIASTPSRDDEVRALLIRLRTGLGSRLEAGELYDLLIEIDAVLTAGPRASQPGSQPPPGKR